MNVLSQSETSDYQNRTVTIEVTGARRQSVMKQGSYQIKVPYSRMSQTMQTIHRRGDRVVSVAVVGGNPSAAHRRADNAEASQPASSRDANGKAPKGEDQKEAKRKRP